ncbi:phytoene/squalene synthase family protein [Blastopirellula marina]|uniref:Squalene/phytoene synthase family protein n=1 Tax=Blastopirellula marina TaxID=124 RepID=A0A2S8F836_9BACT|nr:phytoene/squalene synthase family protein [Blastopirellula marina]PQO28315.1 squalene/phytoene synthase family protein [Blastopirellula marina]PTL41855.1 squalene/phytoene synthase family protein [Blastopirellula marina]
MNDRLAASYAECRRLSRQSGSNFLLSFWFLPREKRQAMFALYAFFRHTDDLADAEGTDQAADLQQWRDDFHAALQDDYRDVRLPALVDTIRRYQIPEQYFLESISGVESDLTRSRFTDFPQLEHYCYQVASAIGLSCLPVWGIRPDFNRESAIATGIAFQLTNILRDIHEDGQRGRIYLPLEDLARFDVTEQALLAGEASPGFEALMRFEIERAQQRFDQARQLRDDLYPDGRRIYDAMTQTYYDLLQQIARDPYAVLQRKIQVGSWRKVKLLASLAFSQIPFRSRQPIAMEARS